MATLEERRAQVELVDRYREDGMNLMDAAKKAGIASSNYYAIKQKLGTHTPGPKRERTKTTILRKKTQPYVETINLTDTTSADTVYLAVGTPHAIAQVMKELR